MHDINTIKAAIEPFVVYFLALFSNGFVASALTEVSKLKQVFIPAQNYPRTTAAVISVLGTLVAMWVSSANLAFNSAWAWVAFAIGSFLVSASSYLRIFKGLSTNTGTAQTTRKA
jgi:hypothetical protein